jgi:heme oxygenase (biliverdin-producing, ferredoxin)
MTILKDITNDKHREIEKLPLIQNMFQGTFTEPMYLHYLYELKHIYHTLETLAAEQGLFNNMPGIQRYDLICKDIEALGGYQDRDLMPATVAYLNYLNGLNLSSPELILAHVYVRHMGDLYGGKLMARVLPGPGYMYQFDDKNTIIKQFNEMLSVSLGDEANIGFDFL